MHPDNLARYIRVLALNQWRRAPGLLMFQESSRSVFADRKCKLSEGRSVPIVGGKETTLVKKK